MESCLRGATPGTCCDGTAGIGLPVGLVLVMVTSMLAAVSHGNAWMRTSSRVRTHVRPVLDRYVAVTMSPMLGLDCHPEVRHRLHTAAGQVLDVAGFVAFDSGHHQQARTRYRQALDVLGHVDAPVMVGQVMTDLAMLAALNVTDARRSILPLRGPEPLMSVDHGPPEPGWVGFFTSERLAAGSVYALCGSETMTGWSLLHPPGRFWRR